MKKENGNDMPFKADEVNWDELSGIGIMKDELELSLSLIHISPNKGYPGFPNVRSSPTNEGHPPSPEHSHPLSPSL